jgi:hypothetical protein
MDTGLRRCDDEFNRAAATGDMALREFDVGYLIIFW